MLVYYAWGKNPTGINPTEKIVCNLWKSIAGTWTLRKYLSTNGLFVVQKIGDADKNHSDSHL